MGWQTYVLDNIDLVAIFVVIEDGIRLYQKVSDTVVPSWEQQL